MLAASARSASQTTPATACEEDVISLEFSQKFDVTCDVVTIRRECDPNRHFCMTTLMASVQDLEILQASTCAPAALR